MTAEFTTVAELWRLLRRDAGLLQTQEPVLAEFVAERILYHRDFAVALGHHLIAELYGASPPVLLPATIDQLYQQQPDLLDHATRDLAAVMARDPAAYAPLAVYLNFKGFQALQAYRVSHRLWQQGRMMLALDLQGRMARCFAVDIHPAAQLGSGIMIDHAHGIVIGETAVVEDDVSMLHSVTLGGTGKETGDRHPKIRRGVMIGAGAKILGNIEIGECARIAAGSVVVQPVPPHVTVAGVPARVIGEAGAHTPAEDMDQLITPSLQ